MQTSPAVEEQSLAPKILSCHRSSSVLSGWNTEDTADMFSIVHHAGPVVYHAAQFAGNIDHVDTA